MPCLRIMSNRNMSAMDQKNEHRAVIIWLYFCCFMVFAMAVIGAVTRLAEAGLSMVEWRPLVGTIPPLSEAEWQRVFDLYRETPEYRLKHYWMGIDDFKYIFFWEWLHRVWGRLIGLAFALPLAWFWLRKKIPPGYGLSLTGLLILGGVQGVIGWWMVTSGLVDEPRVSPYRLAVHLGVAFIIFGWLFWLARNLQNTAHPKATDAAVRGALMKIGLTALALLAVTIIWGAFVAGYKAGLLYNTWPMMNESFTPQSPFTWYAIAYDHGWIQFFHRWVAIVAGGVICFFAFKTRDTLLGLMVVIQIGLGIATLLSQIWIPLAALHQAGALLLLALLLNRLHALCRS